MLVNGKWVEKWQPVQKEDEKGRFQRVEKWQPVQKEDEKGRFQRQASVFRDHQITPEKGRYHLYVALICPWAHRTLITRSLKGLDDVISTTIVEPRLTDQGWAFGSGTGEFKKSETEPHINAEFIHEIYSHSDPHYTGRATVPVLWDKKEQRIINNESADIIGILNSAFGELADDTYELMPDSLRPEMDALNDEIYENLNNGVYKAGFATSQFAYEEACEKVFTQLDALDQRLSDGRRTLFEHGLTQTDIRLYVTLIRFDAAYHGLFKTNKRTIASYKHLQAYLERLYAIPAFKETTDISHIKKGYYSIQQLNPAGLVPIGPDLPWMS